MSNRQHSAKLSHSTLPMSGYSSSKNIKLEKVDQQKTCQKQPIVLLHCTPSQQKPSAQPTRPTTTLSRFSSQVYTHPSHTSTRLDTSEIPASTQKNRAIRFPSKVPACSSLAKLDPNHIDDELALREFLDTRGVFANDIHQAFELLSRDGHKITSGDVKQFMQADFSNSDSMEEEIGKLINGWKDAQTRDQITHILMNRGMSSIPWTEAFSWFQPGDQGLDRNALLKLAKQFSRHGMPIKHSDQILLQLFDRDGDECIGLEDFKRMTL